MTVRPGCLSTTAEKHCASHWGVESPSFRYPPSKNLREKKYKVFEVVFLQYCKIPPHLLGPLIVTNETILTTPQACKRDSSKVCHKVRGPYGLKVPSNQGIFLQKMWDTDPHIWHTDHPPPLFRPALLQKLVAEVFFRFWGGGNLWREFCGIFLTHKI